MRENKLGRADAYQMYLAGLINENAYLNEMLVEDKDLEALVREYSKLTEELAAVKKELQEKEARSKELSAQIAPVLEAMKDTEERTLQVDDIVVSIKKMGTSYQRPHYEKIYSELLTKVDDELRGIMEELKKTLYTQVNVSTSLGVQRAESDMLSRAGAMISGAWRRLLSLIGIANHRIDRAISEFKLGMSESMGD
jgi:seryl-tRNA synthetase